MPGLVPGIFICAAPPFTFARLDRAILLLPAKRMPRSTPGKVRHEVSAKSGSQSALASAFGSSSENIAKSSPVPTVTRMQRLRGATPGMRTKTPAATSASSTRFA